ncbi:unnamed protein product [Polarella glacialis]|uniref:C3H1-type domain-containing protein n=2 Tax=Polarella glacialis TaxID=89957 RepID=A0A813GBM4_POLGL|nr:unnamed protein product [Polarella glacialis]
MDYNTSDAMFYSTCRFGEADETDLPFIQSPEAVVERLRIISSLSMEGSPLLKYYNTATATSSRIRETETDLPLAQSASCRSRSVQFLKSASPQKESNNNNNNNNNNSNINNNKMEVLPNNNNNNNNSNINNNKMEVLPAAGKDGSTLRGDACAQQVSSPSGLPAAEAHRRGVCRPCSYFTMKADSCRQGDACEFCHICTLDEARAWKRHLKAERKGRAVRLIAIKTVTQTIASRVGFCVGA